MYEYDSALRSECAFYIRAAWCVSRALSRGGRESRGITRNSGRAWSQLLAQTDSEGSGSHACGSSARARTCHLPRSKAQLFSSSWQCRCCLLMLNSPWLPPTAASVLLSCRGGGCLPLNACGPSEESRFSKSRTLWCSLDWKRDAAAQCHLLHYPKGQLFL